MLERARAEDMSFMGAVLDGIFTVPGDGCIDFLPLLRLLRERDYAGWLVVEAEQDPAQGASADLCAPWAAKPALARGSFRVGGGRGMNTAGMRAAIVGAGGIARVHARLIRELGGNLVGVCGRTLAAARAFDAEPYDNLQQLLREQKPEVVHVCSPNHLHAEHSMMAFAAGAHVVCEKPMATDADACRRMIEAAGRAQRLGAIAYTYRGYPLIEVLRRQVAEGRFGALRRIGGCYLSQDVWPPDKYVWLFTPGTTGGSYVLMDLGVHWLNLAEYVTGTRILELSAQFSTHQPRRVWRGGTGEGPRPPGVAVADGAVAVETALEDQADLLLRFDNGAAGSLTVSGVSPGHPNYHPAVRRRRRARFRLEPAGAECRG